MALFSSWTSALLSATAVSVVGLTAALYRYQGKLLYFPSVPSDARSNVVQPPQIGLRNYENVFFHTADGVKLHAFLLKAASHSSAPTLVYFHGNAGNIGHRLVNARDLVHQVRANVLLVSYRGYGFSEGEPSEPGLRLDGEAAIDFLAARSDLDHSKIFVFGRSLGGAVAIHLASKHQSRLRGIILENTFTSIADMIDVVLPVFKVFKPLLTNPWRSADALPDVDLPILFLAGEADELVPHSMMLELHAMARHKDSQLSTFPNGRHNETWLTAGYYEVIAEWLGRVSQS